MRIFYLSIMIAGILPYKCFATSTSGSVNFLGITRSDRFSNYKTTLGLSAIEEDEEDQYLAEHNAKVAYINKYEEYKVSDNWKALSEATKVKLACFIANLKETL